VRFRAEVLHVTESRPGERVKNVFVLIGAERIGEISPG
jgi:hypothetical protein